MSYEGDLVAHYDATHKRLLDPPTAIKKTPPLVPHPPTELSQFPAILLRLEAIERGISELNRILLKAECKTDAINAKNAQQRLLSVEKILEIVCKREGIYRAEIVSPQRHGEIVMARHIAFYLASKWTKRSLTQIGNLIGGRDHSSVIRGIQKLECKRHISSDLDSKLFWYENHLAGLVDKSGDNGDKPAAILTEVTEHP